MPRRRPAPTTTRIDLVEASESDKPVLNVLLQLYQYDFSELARGDPQHGDVGEDGLFRSIDLDSFFARDERYAYLIRADGRLAGFVLVSRGSSFRTPGEPVWWIDEFFVMRKYRRMGIGEHAATAMFDRFGGSWQVAQMDVNTGAQAFWRDVISRYTEGRFEEVWFEDDRWLGPVQFFRSGAEA